MMTMHRRYCCTTENGEPHDDECPGPDRRAEIARIERIFVGFVTMLRDNPCIPIPHSLSMSSRASFDETEAISQQLLQEPAFFIAEGVNCVMLYDLVRQYVRPEDAGSSYLPVSVHGKSEE